MKLITPGLLPEERGSRTRSVLTRYPGIETNAHYNALTKYYGEPVLPKGYALSILAEKDVSVVTRGQEVPEGLLWFTISTDQVDRANDRVVPAGMRVRNFASNPVILWSHNHELPAIGRAEAYRSPVSLPDGRAAVLMGIRFQEVTELARDVGELVKQGYIRTGSIGFIPLSWTEEPVSKYADAYDFTDTVRSYTEWELLEFSLCNIPMNPGASVYEDLGRVAGEAVARGVISADSEFLRAVGLRGKIVLPTVAASIDWGSLPVWDGNGNESTLQATLLSMPTKTQDDAPNYVESTDDAISCATCAFFEEGMCTKHEFEADPTYACDDYQAKEDNTATEDDPPTDPPADPATDDATLTLLRSLPTMNISTLAQESGLSVEQLTALAATITEKGLLETLAEGEIMQKIWPINWALYDVLCDAIEAHQKGSATATDSLVEDYTKAANLLIPLIKSLPQEGGEGSEETPTETPAEGDVPAEDAPAQMSLRAFLVAKAGAVLSAKNKGRIVQAKDLLVEALAEAEADAEKSVTKATDIADALATGDSSLGERMDDLESGMTKVLHQLGAIAAHMKSSAATPTPAEDDTPIMRIDI